ncbi:MAG: D-aminoacyl-tRNA deacylase [Actinomycetota bacterium]|nr:D-aminoacyl-tRNA deacylase [Actinomycetota bacterium]
MRAVVQRVASCSVSVEGTQVGRIGEGLLVLVGVAKTDDVSNAEYLAEKILNLRLFPDSSGKMNLSILDTGGEMMVVSQFTLVCDLRKGRRPSFEGAAEPSQAEELYKRFVSFLEKSGLEVKTGKFGALMMVDLRNWGPLTFVIDTPV